MNEESVKVQKGRCHDVMQCRETSKQLILHLLENKITPLDQQKDETKHHSRYVLCEFAQREDGCVVNPPQSFVSTTPVSSSYYIQPSRADC